MPWGLCYNENRDHDQVEMPCKQPTKHRRRRGIRGCSQRCEIYGEIFFFQGMSRLKLENPALLAQHAQDYIYHLNAEGKKNPPFTCDVVVVLGGNIVKSGMGFITTPYTKGTKKSFGAQGRVITAAFLYHQGVCDCIILSTGKTDPEDQDALEREGVKSEGGTIKYISSDTMLCRYLPEFRADMYTLYRRPEMKERIQDERNGYDALKNGTYQSRPLKRV